MIIQRKTARYMAAAEALEQKRVCMAGAEYVREERAGEVRREGRHRQVTGLAAH